MKQGKEYNCICPICGVAFYTKPSRLKRTKNGVCCSMLCGRKLRAKFMLGMGNHQYGLTGKLNSSYKHDEKINNAGYRMINVPGHPKGAKDRRYDEMTYILEHRLVIEQNYNFFPKEFFEMKNGWLVLKDCYDVHHINHDKLDNRLENLVIITRGEHTTLHNFEKQIIRDCKTGRIIGVIKQGELLENPEVDNQQPSQDGNILKGSTTNNRTHECGQ